MVKAAPLLALLVGVALIPVVLGARDRKSPRPSSTPVDQLARDAGCRVNEFGAEAGQNPPVTGRFSERDRAADGSYVDRRTPSLAATIHAIYHGRVLIQYRSDLDKRQIGKLQRMVFSDPDRVLLFTNQTGMRAPVAATSYLSVMTCPRVDANTLRALRVYRDRRQGFGQAF
jgi:hypothetical protein